MTKYREILRLTSLGISQRDIAASCSCSRKTIIKVHKRAKEMNIAWPLSVETTDGELDKLFFPKSDNTSIRRFPELEFIHREMAKSGVTLKLLWSEYIEECRVKHELPLMYSQFCYHYQKFAETKRASMHILRKPGEQVEVDWSGQTASIVDRDTGEIIPVYVFVAALSYSQYAYVEAFLSQDIESWISAHINMYHFYGGVTRILIPDNLKTGVEKASWYGNDPVINKTYHEMAEHYNTAVIPARVRRPKDKPNTERTVGIISTWIIAALRNYKFFSLHELNQAIKEKLHTFNSKPFQKKKAAGRASFLPKKKHCCYHYLPLLMNWHSGRRQLYSSIITYP